MTPIAGPEDAPDGPDPGVDADDAIWKALANPLRRRMLDELRSGPLRTSALAARFTESRHVVMQHLNVLREVDLVRSLPQGRARLNYLNPVPIQQINRRWVSRYEGLWAEALLGLKEHVEEQEHAVETKQGEQRSG